MHLFRISFPNTTIPPQRSRYALPCERPRHAFQKKPSDAKKGQPSPPHRQSGLPHFAANLLLALSAAPYFQSTNMPITPMTVSPASKLTPRPTPKFKKSGRANRIAPAARLERAKSLPAKSEAAYCGYCKNNQRQRTDAWKGGGGGRKHSQSKECR